MTKTVLGTPGEEPKRRRGRRIRKRSNGEGSIWPRKDGRYGYAAFVPSTTGTVKRVQGSARTQEEARKRLTALLRQADEGIPVSSENWTLADFLTYWLKNIVSQERRPKTYQGYESVVRLHLVPGLGRKRLAKLNAQDVRLFINRIRSECQCCRNGWDASRAKPVCCALTNGQCCDSPRRPTAAAHVLRAMPSRKLARPPGSRQHRPRHEPRPRHVRTPVLGRLAAPLRQRQARTPAPCQETGCTPFTAFSQSDLRICASRP